MLEYENQMFLDILHQDGLLISAKGLNTERVIANLIKVYCDPGNLVIVLGTTANEESSYIEELRDQNVSFLPRIIAAENSPLERERIYTEGGVLFVSGRIMVVDLLKKRIPLEQVTGFIVTHAHKLKQACADAFALHLYRRGNKTGFIKAFSSSPEGIVHRYVGFTDIMKMIFVRNLYLYPRFHALVCASVEKCKVEVIELKFPISKKARAIETALDKLLKQVISDIKRTNSLIDPDLLTSEAVIAKSFHKLISTHFSSPWDLLNDQTKNLVNDLKVLRQLIFCCLDMDSVRFYSLLNSVRSMDYVRRSSGWMMLKDAETLFVAAKRRVITDKEEVHPELNAKWLGLKDVLSEIRQNSTEPETVLILTNNVEVCKQVKNCLVKDPRHYLREMYEKHIGKSQDTISVLDESPEDTNGFCLTQSGGSSYDECDLDKVGKEPVVVLQHYKRELFHTTQLLNNLKPRQIIIYDLNMAAIREVEVYQARNPTFQLTVYVFLYNSSVERVAYKQIVAREKEAFEFLIKSKAEMPVPYEQEGKEGFCEQLFRKGRDEEAAETNTRKGGGAERSTVPTIIVDMREFRSRLPECLYRLGVDIIPVTLQVGDYILSPEICVERKAIGDLISSLRSGRLYQQILSMSRHYPKPTLLVDFENEGSAFFHNAYFLNRDMSREDIQDKLQILAKQFPKLNIIYSNDPVHSAFFLCSLKEQRAKEEPDQIAAALVGQDEGIYDDRKYSQTVKDFLSKLPGVTQQNVTLLLNKVVNMETLLNLTKDELKNVLQNTANAESLYNALHERRTNLPVENGSAETSRFKKNGGTSETAMASGAAVSKPFLKKTHGNADQAPSDLSSRSDIEEVGGSNVTENTSSKPNVGAKRRKKCSD